MFIFTSNVNYTNEAKPIHWDFSTGSAFSNVWLLASSFIVAAAAGVVANKNAFDERCIYMYFTKNGDKQQQRLANWQMPFRFFHLIAKASGSK